VVEAGLRSAANAIARSAIVGATTMADHRKPQSVVENGQLHPGSRSPSGDSAAMNQR